MYKRQVCNEAALIAARHGKNAVGKQDFLDAVDRIIGGLEKKTKIMTSEEKRTIALHLSLIDICFILEWLYAYTFSKVQQELLNLLQVCLLYTSRCV